MAYCSALPLKFFFLYYHRSIHLPFNLCIKDTDFDTLSKQGHTNRYVLSTDQFLKTVLWLYCDNQPFSSPNDPFFEPYRAEMELWSPRLFFYTCISGPTPQISNGGKLASELETKKKEKILLLKCHLSPFMIVCMGSMSIQEMALLP